MLNLSHCKKYLKIPEIFEKEVNFKLVHQDISGSCWITRNALLNFDFYVERTRSQKCHLMGLCTPHCDIYK